MTLISSTCDLSLFYCSFVVVLVAFSCAQSDSDGIAADELILQLLGKAATRVVRTYTKSKDWTGDKSSLSSVSNSVKDRQVMTDSKEFLKFDVKLAAFGERVTSGKHSFPFAITLPPNLPSTMKVRCARSYYVLVCTSMYVLCVCN